ncbi:hypothetical protein BIU88_00920 [Chlorobaculum limnaeum]|uniref:Uncharacterized protein n=1 Tax=Chlorobaculum limnaeum TaxID=274537 RepID=A0A1D8D246_CHLLM|nr:hypothetical protein BIU88_00920 [Chlorobaculum limnaeum]
MIFCFAFEFKHSGVQSFRATGPALDERKIVQFGHGAGWWGQVTFRFFVRNVNFGTVQYVAKNRPCIAEAPFSQEPLHFFQTLWVINFISVHSKYPGVCSCIRCDCIMRFPWMRYSGKAYFWVIRCKGADDFIGIIARFVVGYDDFITEVEYIAERLFDITVFIFGSS